MNADVSEVLVTKEQIREKVQQIGRAISQDYEGKDLALIGVLKGGCVFLSDLIREISININLDFIAVSSYGQSTTTSGVVRLIKDVDIDVKDKHVLLVEDIIDTGLTLKYLKELFMAREPKSVKVCSILDKPSRRKVEIKGDYVGFEIPNEFVIGYGLDYMEKYRNLPEICVLNPSVYSEGR